MLMRCHTAHTTSQGTGADTIVPVNAIVEDDDHLYIEASHLFEPVVATFHCHGGACAQAREDARANEAGARRAGRR